MDMHRQLSAPAGEFRHRAFDDLLGHRQRFGDLRVTLGADAGDGQEILHDADQPAGVLIGGGGQLMALLHRQRLLLLQQHIGGADNAGQRRADIMRYRPQQVGMDTLPLRLPLEDLHLLGTAGQHTRDHGNEHHDDERQREARQGKADLPIWHGEHIVHTQHAGNGDQNAEQVSVRQQRRQKHVQKEDHRHIAGVTVGIHRPQQQTQQHRGKEKRHGNNEVSAGV